MFGRGDRHSRYRGRRLAVAGLGLALLAPDTAPEGPDEPPGIPSVTIEPRAQPPTGELPDEPPGLPSVTIERRDEPPGLPEIPPERSNVPAERPSVPREPAPPTEFDEPSEVPAPPTQPDPPSEVPAPSPEQVDDPPRAPDRPTPVPPPTRPSRASDPSAHFLDDVDAVLTLNPDGRTRETTRFDHAKHARGDYFDDASCATCHHDTAAGEKPEPCSACHAPDGEAGETRAKTKASHSSRHPFPMRSGQDAVSCIGCHKAMNRLRDAGRRLGERAPVKCADCHARK